MTSGAAVLLAAVVALAAALDNGVGVLPVMGWSSWNTFRYNVTADLVLEMAHVMVASGLRDAGYEYLLIDDGWPLCAEGGGAARCTTPAPRDAAGRIVVDPAKFPAGFAPVTAAVHALGLKIGIYTAVSAVTCGGFTASLGHEEVDAQSFADWGFDFVKHDTCNTDCGVHDYCLQNSTARMSAALNATGRPMVYYVDAGNPSSPQRVYNPLQASVTNPEALAKLATRPSELAWVWAAGVAHMYKSWFDVEDRWGSTLSNAQNQIRVAEYQRCGAIHSPDMLTVGQGGQTLAQYRAQFVLWSVLGAPLVLGADLTRLSAAELALVTAPEALAVAQDPLCVQGSLARAEEAFEIWARPLADGSFAVAVVNKALLAPATVVVRLVDQPRGYSDLHPAELPCATVRDTLQRASLGLARGTFAATVGPTDAALFRVTPAPCPPAT